MDIAGIKLELISWLIQLTDKQTINRIFSVKKIVESDWWNQLDEEEKTDIFQGLLDVENGDHKAHQKVMEKYEKYL